MPKPLTTLIPGLLLLVAFPAWAGLLPASVAGTWMLALTVLAWGCFFAEPESKRIPSRAARSLKLFRDPSCWGALAFTVWIFFRLFFSGNPDLPGAAAHNRFAGITSVLTAFLVLKHSWTHLHIRIVLWLVGLNGFLCALTALTSHALSGYQMYGSFGSPNHAAIFFTLLFCLSIGLAFKEVLSESSDRNLYTFYFSCIWIITFLLAANLSTSRMGILGPWFVWVCSFSVVSIVAWPRTHPVQRLYGLLVFVLLSSLFIAAFVLTAREIHFQELTQATRELNVAEETDKRIPGITKSLEQWKQHPFVGNGMEPDPQTEQESVNPGRQEWVYLLKEFGFIGLVFFLSIFAVPVFHMLHNLRRKPTHDDSLWSDPLKICAFWGCVLLVATSLFDIPFRNPAVFMQGILLFQLLTPHPDRPSIWPNVIDWQRLQPPLTRMKNQVRELTPESLEE